VAVKIGGLNTARAETVYIKEPTMEVVERQILQVVDTISALSDDNKAKLDEIQELDAAMIKDLARLKPIQRLLEDLLGQVVGKDADYVRQEMSVKQITRVGTLYVRAIGFEEIRDLFLATKAQLTRPPTEQAVTPTLDPSAAQ
jgi:hypothetical protein